MGIRRKINLFLILCMIGAQLALAQHATVHFALEGYGEIHATQHQDNGHHHKPQADKFCQLCLFAKGLAHALTSEAAIVPPDVFKIGIIFPAILDVPVRQNAKLYQARAPPAFLI